MTEQLHEEDGKLNEENGNDEASCREIGRQLSKVIGIESEIESFQPVEGNLAKVFIITDVVTLLKSQKMPYLNELSRRHDNDQIFKRGHKHSKNKNIISHLSHMQLLP